MNNLIMDDFGMRNNKIDFYTKKRMININNRYTISKRNKGVSYFSITIKRHFPKCEAEKMHDANRCVNSLSYQSHQYIPNMFGILRVL